MTSADWGQLAGLILTALGTLLAHYRITKGGKQPPAK